MISYNIIGNQLKVLQSKRMVGGSNFWAFREKKFPNQNVAQATSETMGVQLLFFLEDITLSN